MALQAVVPSVPAVFWVSGELSTLRQLMKVPNEPGLSPADSRNLLDVVIALRPVIVNHGLGLKPGSFGTFTS